MGTVFRRAAAGGRLGVVSRVASVALIICASPGLAAARGESPILFARGSGVPPPVQAFAWRVIETRCDYQSHERLERSFWAHRAQARAVDGGVAYSIDILSEKPWKKTEPPGLIEMTIVDDGGLRLTDLKSSFINCEAGEPSSSSSMLRW